jgi:hypothetical protein
MNENIFEQMIEAQHPQDATNEPPFPTSTRWKLDGTYDSETQAHSRSIQHPEASILSQKLFQTSKTITISIVAQWSRWF